MQTFCAKLLSHPEEIALCTLSTHSDPQLLPFIWALTLSTLRCVSNAYSCSQVEYPSSLVSVNNTLPRTISTDPILQLPSTINLTIYHSQ